MNRRARVCGAGAAFVLCGGLLAACARPPQARNAATGAAERSPVAAQLLEDGLVFARLGDATRAEQYLNAALEEGADERRVLPVLLSVCIENDRYRAATGYAENYLRRRPSDHRVRFVLATLYVGLDEQLLARKQLQLLLNHHPQHAEAHFAYAVLLRDKAGDHAGADRHFREYLRIAPSGDHAEEAKGSLLQRIP